MGWRHLAGQIQAGLQTEARAWGMPPPLRFQGAWEWADGLAPYLLKACNSSIIKQFLTQCLGL